MNMRLTDIIRGQIAYALLKEKMRDEHAALLERGKSYALDVYEGLVPREYRELPEGVLQKNYSFNVQIGTDVTSLHFSGYFRIFDKDDRNTDYDRYFVKCEPIHHPFPYNKSHGVVKAIPAGGSRIYQEGYRLLEDRASFIKKFLDTRIKVMAVLNSVTSTNRLIETWPEVEQFIPEEKKPVPLPALPINEINTVLRLP